MSNPLPRRPKIRMLLVLPGATLLVFAGLTALSFVEIKVKEAKPLARSSPVQANAELLERYQRETKELQALREKSRADLTPDDILKALEAEKPEDIPAPEVLLAQLRSVERRKEGVPGYFLSRLLSIIRKAPGRNGAEIRADRAEALFSHLAFSSECPELTEADKAALLKVFQWSLERKGKRLGAYLSLLSKVGDEGDVSLLRDLRGLADNRQLAHEFDKVIALLQTKTISRAGDACSGASRTRIPVDSGQRSGGSRTRFRSMPDSVPAITDRQGINDRN